MLAQTISIEDQELRPSSLPRIPDWRAFGRAWLTDELGLSKNSVFRITMTLLGHGYVVRDEQKRFSLSKKLLLMGCQSMGENSFIEQSLDVMNPAR